MTDTFICEASFGTRWAKMQSAFVAKGRFRHREFRIHQKLRRDFFAWHWTESLNAIGGVEILRVEEVARRHQQVFVTVEVHVEERDRPRPGGGFDSREVSDFRIGAVAAIPMKGVAVVLRAIVEDAEDRRVGLYSAELHHPPLAARIEHVGNKDVIAAVAVDVSEIDAHREG